PDGEWSHYAEESGGTRLETTRQRSGDRVKIEDAVQSTEVGENAIEGRFGQSVELLPSELCGVGGMRQATSCDLLRSDLHHVGRDVGGEHVQAASSQMRSVLTSTAVHFED